jgi:hypothetical protein
MAKAGRFHDTAIAPNAGEDFAELRRAESTGRPLGAADFVSGPEKGWYARSNAALREQSFE